MAAHGIRSVYAEAGQAVATLMDRVDDWSAPASESWDVAALCGHLARSARDVADYTHGPVAEDVPIPSAAAYYCAHMRQRAADPEAMDAAITERARGEISSNPPEKFRAAQTAALAAVDWAGPGFVIPTRYGPIQLGEYLRTRNLEFVIHGVDLARAVGDEDWAPPREALADAISLLGEVAAASGRGVALVMLLTGRDEPESSPALPVVCGAD